MPLANMPITMVSPAFLLKAGYLLHLLPLVPIIANHCCARLKMSRDRDEYHLVLFFAGY
jgi:hypothetical protein